MDHVINLCNNNRDYFITDKSENPQKLHSNFIKIAELLEKSKTILDEIESFAADFDFDKDTPGNGYRSFVFIFNAAVKYIESHLKYIAENRGKFLFRKSLHAKYTS